MTLSPPSTKKGRLQRACLDVLRAHEAAGEIPTSVRFVYYELKQAGQLPEEHRVRRVDQDVADAIKHLRDVGLVPWHWINDETRDMTAWAYADTIAGYVLDRIDMASLDAWDGERPPVIICETRGVAGVLKTLSGTYLCPITSTNGQVGGFLHTDVMWHLVEGSSVVYLGDHNVAGDQIEANTRRVLEDEVGELDWERLAVTAEQAEERGLPPKPGTDGRYKDGRPHTSYECEALGQGTLVRMLTEHLDDLLPEPIEDVWEREKTQRELVRKALSGLPH